MMPQSQEDIKVHKENFKALTLQEEIIGKAVVNAAYIVHKELGPGLLEKVYEVCFCHVLTKEGFKVKRQIDVPIVFDNIAFNKKRNKKNGFIALCVSLVPLSLSGKNNDSWKKYS